MGGNYEKEMFRHLQETLEKVDRLTNEITAMNFPAASRGVSKEYVPFSL